MIFCNEGHYTTQLMRRLEFPLPGQTTFLWISRSLSKFLSHFILSSRSRSEDSLPCRILLMVLLSPGSSVFASISFSQSGARSLVQIRRDIVL